MLTPSEEVTRTWIKKKGILVRTRPKPSRFSFVVCLAIVFSIAFGFLGGFLTAGFALSENYSSVYENLLMELENSRRCIEREKEDLQNAQYLLPSSPTIHQMDAPINERNRQQKRGDSGLNKTILSAVAHAVGVTKK